MNKILLTALCIPFFISCNSPAKTADKISDESNVRRVFSDDEEMNNAINKAKQTFTQFDTAFKNGHFDPGSFYLKVRFDVPSGGEHIWADSIYIQNGTYYGVLDEDAVDTDEVKAGDKVKITKENLSDWMYADDGLLVGGYTIRVLRNRMSPQEMASFDSSYFLKIKD